VEPLLRLENIWSLGWFVFTIQREGKKKDDVVLGFFGLNKKLLGFLVTGLLQELYILQ
jgi:hypothetical protein